MRFSTRNVRSLYRAGTLTAAARELARYKLDLMGVQEVRWDREGVQEVRWDREGVQEVRWDRGGTVRAEDYNFFYTKRK